MKKIILHEACAWQHDKPLCKIAKATMKKLSATDPNRGYLLCNDIINLIKVARSSASNWTNNGGRARYHLMWKALSKQRHSYRYKTKELVQLAKILKAKNVQFKGALGKLSYLTKA